MKSYKKAVYTTYQLMPGADGVHPQYLDTNLRGKSKPYARKKNTFVARTRGSVLFDKHVCKYIYIYIDGGDSLVDIISVKIHVHQPLCKTPLAWKNPWPYGCGSRIGTQNRTLVKGNMDIQTCGPIPGALILTHSHTWYTSEGYSSMVPMGALAASGAGNLAIHRFAILHLPR